MKAAGPISVTETTLFRIASWTEAGGYSERLNLHIVVKPEEAEPVSAVWNENRCTVTLERVDSGVQTIAASYDPYGKILQVEYLTAEKATVTLIGDSVKVFFIDQGSYAPVRKALDLQP